MSSAVHSLLHRRPLLAARDVSSRNNHKNPIVNRSVRRVFAVTEAVVRAPGRVSATELAAQTGYPYTTVVADLKSLQGLGYVTFDPDTKTYAPTLKITLLASALSPRTRLVQEIRRAVDDLAATTRETAILWGRVGDEMQALHVALGQEPLRMVVAPGLSYAIPRSASGRAYSMTVPPKPASRASKASLDEAAEVQRCVRRGYATAYELLEPHVGSIAAPLVIRHGNGDGADVDVFAVSVGGAAQRIKVREPEIAATLLGAVAALETRCAKIIRSETA